MRNADAMKERRKIWAFKEFAVWLAIFTAYYAFAVATGAQNMDDFSVVFRKSIAFFKTLLATLLPYWSNPFVLIATALVIWWQGLSGVIHLTRHIAAFFAAYFLLRSGLHWLVIYPVSVSPTDTAIGLAALAWYMFANKSINLSRLKALRDRLGAD